MYQQQSKPPFQYQEQQQQIQQDQSTNHYQQRTNNNTSKNINTNNTNTNNNTNSKPKNTQYLQLPKQYLKAKRTLTKLINQYFINLKQQLQYLSKNPTITYKYIYCRQYLPLIQSILSKITTIRYTNMNTIIPKKSQLVDDFLLSYIPEECKIIKYNVKIHSTNKQKPKQLIIQNKNQDNSKKYQLPDHATPAAYGINAYLFDSSVFDKKRLVYIPQQKNYKINLLTGQINQLINQPQFYRIKCCIIKIKNGFLIIGGYVGTNKLITRRCYKYLIQSQKFYEIAKLNLFHHCPSGCIHNNNIYIFSKQGIQIYNPLQNIWQIVECNKIPKRLHILPYQYCISISNKQIMIFGGKQCNENNRDIKIYNTQLGIIDQYIGVLPVGVSNQRSWGPMIINNFITILSNIQACNYPQVAIKRDAVQVVLIGYGGCYLNSFMCS